MKKEELPEINWDIITPELIKVFTPFIQAIAWLGLSKLDPKVNAMNNLIAIAEVVPAVDLNLPRGIVLAAMYDKTTDALKMMADLLDVLEDIPENLKNLIKDMVDESKEAVTEILDPVTEASHDFQNALGDCRSNAQGYLGTGHRYRALGGLWIVSCMQQKGFKIGIDYIKDKLF
jgi:hypothetical protein